jgi:hypothetical protein
MKNFLKDGSLIGERNVAIEFFCLVGLLHPNLPFGLSRLLAFAAFDVLKSILFSEFVNLFLRNLFGQQKTQLFYGWVKKTRYSTQDYTPPSQFCADFGLSDVIKYRIVFSSYTRF